MFDDIPAADLPAIEPTDAELIDLLTLPWEETQGHFERLLVEAGRVEQARAAAEDAEVYAIPVAASGGELGVAA